MATTKIIIKATVGTGPDAKGVEVTISPEEILRLSGCGDAKPHTTILELEEEGKGKVYATSSDDGPDYVGIYMSAEKGDKLFELAHAELPTPDNKNITARLYAGDQDTETDGPIAMTQCGIRKEGDKSRRVVYVDHDYAWVKDWGTASRFVTTERGDA